MAGFPSVAKGNKLGEKAKRPHPGVPLDKNVIANLLVVHTGNISRVADSMGSTRGCVRRVIDNHEDLKQILADCRERQIDNLEASVFQRAVDSNDTTLQLFVLKTQGKHRGWEQSEAQNAAKDIATAALDFIVNKTKNPAEHTK